MKHARNIVMLAAAAVSIYLLVLIFTLPPVSPRTILDSLEKGDVTDGISMVYPLNGTIFPLGIPAPQIIWEDSNKSSNIWFVSILADDEDFEPLHRIIDSQKYKLSFKVWKNIQDLTLGSNVTIRIIGLSSTQSVTVNSVSTISISVSKDKLTDSLFYREVNLPFKEAVLDPSKIKWRYGSITSEQQPPVVLENLPVCGNCHSFSRDGSVMGMDIDYANDKGSYALVPVEKETILSKERIISWSNYKRKDQVFTFGLLSQVSPDGRYVVSTVKDRSVFVAKDDLTCSQLFFPVKGILVIYDTQTKKSFPLKGANNPAYVQSNPAWSHNGRYILFTRARAYKLKAPGGKILLDQKECKEFIKGGKSFCFDIYRIPFNNGNGGKPEPLKGASNNGFSNFFPKYSPDGKWVVFCKAKSFMLLQLDSELYIIPAGGGKARRMKCNTSNMNSWHSWSSDSKWLIFSSKQFSPYTQLFLTHIDEKGFDSPAVFLPHLSSLKMAANIPEFVNLPADAIVKITEKYIDDYSYLRAATELLVEGREEKANEFYHKSLKENPDNIDAKLNIVLLYIKRGNLDLAEAKCNDMIKQYPNIPKFLNTMAIIKSGQKNLEGAVQYCKLALAADPQKTVLIEIHINLGVYLAQLGYLDEAIEETKKALLIDPNIKDAIFNLRILFKKKRRLEQTE